jgi:hypothetical protein
MSSAPPSAGDEIATGSKIMSARVAELRQLFSAIDPSPFHERDLDPRAEEFIVGWAEDLPRNAQLSLLIHLGRKAGRADEATLLGEAIRRYFKSQMVRSQRTLRELFHRGRISLLIAVAFLSVSIALGDALAGHFADSRFAVLLQEGLLIAGWVAMWRPLEVFLYDWWPIRARVRLFERLGAMPVRIEYQDTVSTNDWRTDWPEAARGRATPEGVS